MKKRNHLFVVLTSILFTGIMFFSCQPQKVDVTDQIKEANEAFMEAFNNGDAHAVAMNYTSEAKLFPANSDAIEGPEAIESFWNGALGMGVAKAELKTVNAEAVGNMAVEEGTYKLFTKDNQVIDHGKYIVSWKKVDGKWKLDKDIWNTSVLLNPVIGAWNLVAFKQVSDGSLTYNFPDGNVEGSQIKIWTNGHFCFSGHYVQNGEKMDNYGGGSYIMNGNIYEEHLDYFPLASSVGNTVKLKIEMKGDTLIQTYPVDADGNIDKNNYSVEKYLRLD